MNKKFFTLVALLGLFVSFGANAQIATDTYPMKSGNYYFMKTSPINGEAHFLSIGPKASGDSIVAYQETKLLALGDSALWKVIFKLDDVTGVYAYTITNKVSGKQLSFNGNGKTVLAPASRTSNVATMGGSLKFTFGSTSNFNPLADTDQDRAKFYSYIASQDSTVQLYIPTTVAAANGGIPVSFVKTKGENTIDPSSVMKISFRKPDPRLLTADELNAIMNGNGFQMFAFYNNVPVAKDENNQLSGIRFIAQGIDTDYDVDGRPIGGDIDGENTDVYLMQAKNPIRRANGMLAYTYAFVDTIAYNFSAAPADGSGMTFRTDTMRADGGAPTKSYFTFTIDPNIDNAYDSVLVRVYNSYNGQTHAAIANNFPMQVNNLRTLQTDEYILTTGAPAVGPNTNTRISLKTGEVPSDVLDINKVYSVKFLNKAANYEFVPYFDAAGNSFEGMYAAVNLANGFAVSAQAYDYIPATQFVFNGSDLLTNRENEFVGFHYIYHVDGDTFTNGVDTIEVKAMTVDPKDKTVGYARFSDYDLTNKTYSLDYVGALLEGLSISIEADSILNATSEPMMFKFVKSTPTPYAFGPTAVANGVVQLDRNSYYLVSTDGKCVVTWTAFGGGVAFNYKYTLKNTNGVIAPSAQPFFFRQVETIDDKATYILTDGYSNSWNYTDKVNVNSTTAELESVPVLYSNNAFQINNEFDAPYKRDAGKHMSFESEDVIGFLSADANLFSVVKREGDVKATYSEDDFKLWVDTAKVKGTEAAPYYYILKGATYVDDTLKGNFLRVMTDSIAKAGYYINVDGVDRARMQFVKAQRAAEGGDSLKIGAATKYEKDAAKIAQFRFKMKYTSKTATDKVKFENFDKNGVSAGFLAYQNGVVYLTNKEEAALKLTFASTSAPTANEEAIAGFTVESTQGAVIVKGAANKAVTIVNVLGQTIANKTIGSDYETIAAPAGVVFVTINGQTVKALVK